MAWTGSRIIMSNLSTDWYIIIGIIIYHSVLRDQLRLSTMDLPCLAAQGEGAKNRLMQQMEKFQQQKGMRNFRMLIKIPMMGHRFKLGRGRSPGGS